MQNLLQAHTDTREATAEEVKLQARKIEDLQTQISILNNCLLLQHEDLLAIQRNEHECLQQKIALQIKVSIATNINKYLIT